MTEYRKDTELKFGAEIMQNGDMDAAYVIVPYDMWEVYGKGRVLVDATFDEVPYQGQVVKMGTPFFIIGLNKQIRKAIGKTFGDTVEVTLKEREGQKKDSDKKDHKAKEELWTCPKCGRQFKKQNQGHYCGKKPGTIEEYILMQDEDKRGDLETVREILKAALPEAEERISWSMPTYWQGHNIIHFAASKKHIGLYPGPEAVEHFALELKPYKTSRGTIQIPYGKLDADLITRIAKWCLETGHHA